MEDPLICPNKLFRFLWDLQHIHSLSKNFADFGYVFLKPLFPLTGKKEPKDFKGPLIKMPVRTTIASVEEFKNILKNNENWVILKFSATWCAPCKRAAPIVDPWLEKVQEQPYLLFLLDIDENFELYGYLKSKKRVQTIPALLAYKKGNTDIIPDLFVSGSDPSHINTFFQSVLYPPV